MKYIILIFIEILISWSITSCQTNSGQQENNIVKNKDLKITADFVPGPTIEPASSLLSSLQQISGQDSITKRLRLRIPVTIEFENIDSDEIERCYIGIELYQSGNLQLTLDDSALGIPIAEQVKMLCPDTISCSLWLEGYWGELMGDETEKTDLDQSLTTIWPFAVLKCYELKASELPLTVFVEKH